MTVVRRIDGKTLEAAAVSVGTVATGGDLAPTGNTDSANRLGRLYAENQERLLAFLARRLASVQDAEDVSHEAFMRFWTAYGGGSAIENPLAMLCRIAINIVRDGARLHRYRSRQMASFGNTACAPQPEPGPDAVLSTTQRTRRIREAVDTLPPRCREVFLLHIFGGMSHVRIARLLNISPAAVEKHIMRAYARLRGELRQDDAFGPTGHIG